MQIENKLRHEINAADKSFIISNVLKSFFWMLPEKSHLRKSEKTTSGL